MTPQLIAVIIFAVLMIVIMIAYRKSTLEKLELLPGEETLFEEADITVEQAGASEGVVFKWCVVRVTRRRIIIAQKLFLRKNVHALRFVITHDGSARDTDLRNTLMRGFLSFAVNKSDMKIHAAPSGAVIKIAIPEGALTRNQYIQLTTLKASEYDRILSGNV
jgi:hypothetical protein